MAMCVFIKKIIDVFYFHFSICEAETFVPWKFFRENNSIPMILCEIAHRVFTVTLCFWQLFISLTNASKYTIINMKNANNIAY